MSTPKAICNFCCVAPATASVGEAHSKTAVVACHNCQEAYCKVHGYAKLIIGVVNDSPVLADFSCHLCTLSRVCRNRYCNQVFCGDIRKRYCEDCTSVGVCTQPTKLAAAGVAYTAY